MSNDITLDVEPEQQVSNFDAFARDGLGRIVRAVALAMHDQTAADQALNSAIRSARRRWHEPTVQTDPGRFVFGTAIAHEIERRAVDSKSTSEAQPLIGPACTVAYFGLGWSVDTISHTLQLSPEAVDRHLDHARDHGFAHAQPRVTNTSADIGFQIRTLLDEAEAPQPDLKRIERQHRWGARRGRIKIVALATVAALALLVLLAQLVQRPDRIEQATVEPEPVPTATPLPATANQAAGAIGNEPRPDLVPRPELITTDGDGGFVGVRSASAQNPQVVFTRSTNGETWSLASRWSLSPRTVVSRFERSGDYYMSWIEDVATSSESVIGTVGISRDLIAWTVVELALDDPAPFGLIYTTQITDLSVSGNNILALATTTVEIDFAALSLSEGYTCGQTVTDQEVVVKLCNDGELDVLSLSGVEVLPARNRLFVSRRGQPFVPTQVPFGDQTAAHLTSVNGSFAVTDETGMRFAISNDAESWQTITAGKPPFPVRAAATNPTNEVVGLGDHSDGQIVLFHNDGQSANTVVTPLNDLIDITDLDVQAVVASGPSRWAVYVFVPSSKAWLLTSEDGLHWSALATSAPSDDSPRLLVGDDEALLQWTDENNETVTLGIPLS